eukprot:2205455-Rhodomonas_salina.1
MASARSERAAVRGSNRRCERGSAERIWTWKKRPRNVGAIAARIAAVKSSRAASNACAVIRSVTEKSTLASSTSRTEISNSLETATPGPDARTRTVYLDCASKSKGLDDRSLSPSMENGPLPATPK